MYQFSDGFPDTHRDTPQVRDNVFNVLFYYGKDIIGKQVRNVHFVISHFLATFLNCLPLALKGPPHCRDNRGTFSFHGNSILAVFSFEQNPPGGALDRTQWSHKNGFDTIQPQSELNPGEQGP